jgi:hypothetical protein
VRYAYAGDDPTDYIDPSGLCWQPTPDSGQVNECVACWLPFAGLADLAAGFLDGLFSSAAEGAADTVTVGRWMSQSELDAMQETGQVQESLNNGVTSVTLPPNPAAYTNAPPGDVFVQFDVPQSPIGASDGVWGKIYGPNSIFGPIRGITEMPPAATNIVVPGQ